MNHIEAPFVYIPRLSPPQPKSNEVLMKEIKPVSRANIRNFVTSVTRNYPLLEPVVDIGCGYRTNRPEAFGNKSQNSGIYIAFDQQDLSYNVEDPNACQNLRADACNIPLPDKSANTVICTELLEHVEYDRVVLSEIARITANGGKLIMTIPGQDVPLHQKKYQHDFRRYTTGEIENMIKQVGFNNIDMSLCYFKGLEINILITAIRQIHSHNHDWHF